MSTSTHVSNDQIEYGLDGESWPVQLKRATIRVGQQRWVHSCYVWVTGRWSSIPADHQRRFPKIGSRAELCRVRILWSGEVKFPSRSSLVRLPRLPNLRPSITCLTRLTGYALPKYSKFMPAVNGSLRRPRSYLQLIENVEFHPKQFKLSITGKHNGERFICSTCLADSFAVHRWSAIL